MNKNGSQVMLRTIVKSVEFELDKVTSMTLSNGTELSPDYVVFALQQDLLLKMLPD